MAETKWTDLIGHETRIHFEEHLSTARRVGERPWVPLSACSGKDTDVFFDERRQREAKAICAGCPVISECLEYALSQTKLDRGGGVYAGLNETELARENRRRRRASTRGSLHH